MQQKVLPFILLQHIMVFTTKRFTIAIIITYQTINEWMLYFISL